jgi:signal transduction histidine kinase
MSVVGGTRQLMRLVADQMAATAEKARLIDDLRRTNDALVASNTALEQQYSDVLEARRVKDEFLANISHELRTPLTAVIGYISLMQEGAVGEITEEQNETLDQVKASSEHLLTLIADLLELTALKRGALDFDITEVDPREPLREALATSFGRKKGVQLEVVEPEGDVPMMRTDRKKVTKALRALIDNAFKFTPKGTVTVSVEVSGPHVAYTVQDTGIGIPVDAQQLIFDEFRQLDGSLTRTYGGSGLGLSLARRLARLVQGDISLESEPGAGSTFRLDLPLRMT